MHHLRPGMGSQYYEQPFDNPPTYVESTSRPSRPARPAAGAPPAGGSSSGPAFATSGGWTPPAGSWEPANGHAVAAGAVPPLPPRQNSSVNQVHAHDAQPSTSTSSSNSNGAAYPEEKRSSGLFGGFGRRSKSEKDREREESSSSSDENAQAGGSSFWRGRHQPQAASTSNAASNGKGKGRQPAHRAEEAPSSRFTDSSDAALRAYLSRIPPDAQKALAPLVMTGDAKSIDGTYSVELTATSKWVSAANNAGTHVYPACSLIANARNDIDVTIYLRPNEAQRQQDLLAQQQRPANAPPLPPRRDNSIPLEMLMRAARGRIRFSLPERLPDRPLRIICSGDCKPHFISLCHRSDVNE